MNRLEHVQYEHISEDFQGTVNTSAEVVLSLLLEFCDQLVIRVYASFIRRVVSNMLQKFVRITHLVTTELRH